MPAIFGKGTNSQHEVGLNKTLTFKNKLADPNYVDF